MFKAAKRNPALDLVACALLLVAAPSSWADDPEPGQTPPPQAAAAEPMAAAPVPTAAERAVIEEIVVTSRKREENLLEVPESIAAFSEVQIDRANISGLSDISLLVPNLYMGRRADGFPNVSIRGLGAFGNTQGVGFYLDDVQIFGDASSRFGDIQRIEVLKGPQGILYGGANIGGAIKWVLNRPDPAEFSGRVRLSAGEDDYYDTELELNVPLAESWAARLFYFGETDDSYLENPNSVRLNGERNNNDRNVGEIHRYGARASIAGELTERLSLYASLRYNESDGPNNHWSREIDGNLRYTDEVDTSRNDAHDRKTWGWSVELNYDFDAFMLTSITSNTDTDSERQTDLDLTQEYVFDLFRDHRFDVFTQELRLTSSGSGPFQWQLGGYYQELERHGRGEFIFSDGFGLLFEDPPRIPTPEEEKLVFFTDPGAGEGDRENVAGFANGSYRWNVLEFSAGVRVDTWEAKSKDLDSGVSGDQKDTETLFRGSVSWFFDDDRSMLYALYSQGFEPGDFNGTSLEGERDLFGYGREKATNHELGYKGRLWDDRVVLTGAVFRIDYKDRQIELQLDTSEGPVEAIINAGDSRNWGWEAELQALLHPDWTFSAGFGYLDAEWKSGTRSPFTGRSMSGRTPLNASDWSAFYALDWNHEFDANLRGFGRLQVRQKGPATTNAIFFDTEGDDFPIWENDRFTVVDLNVGLEWQNWEFGLRLENVFDEEYYIDVQEFPNFAGPLVTPQSAIIIGTLEQPRRLMGWVQYRF